jgi:rubrerythrin
MFITFHGRLEDSIKTFYEMLASKETYAGVRDAFFALAKENGKHKEMVLRTYREVITDAFEGGFPLTNLDEKDYLLKTALPDSLSLVDVLKLAVEIEEKSRKFCEDAASSTEGLMADVPQAFEWVAKRKTRRIKKLESLS